MESTWKNGLVPSDLSVDALRVLDDGGLHLALVTGADDRHPDYPDDFERAPAGRRP